MSKSSSILGYKPIRKFIDGVGDDVIGYLGKDKACVISYGDDGLFYGEGIYMWLKNKGMPVVFAEVDQEFGGLDDEKVRGRKVLVVDNDIITGTSYRYAMEYLRSRRDELEIRDVKYAVMCDRTSLADFSVEDYTTSAGSEMLKIDSRDFKILQLLKKNGRVSFASVAKEVGLTVSGAKKRVEKLMMNDVVEVEGRVNIRKFYSVSAVINAEVDPKAVSGFLKKLEKSPLVYCLLRVYDVHNVVILAVASSMEQINDFIDKCVSSESGVGGIVVHIGDIPIVPRSK